jgi:hypothetical protein
MGRLTRGVPAQVDAMVLSGCRICGNLTYEKTHLGGGSRRRCGPTEEQQSIGQAKRILVGVDAHLRGYQTARKIEKALGNRSEKALGDRSDVRALGAPVVDELLFVPLSVEPAGGKRRSREEFQLLMATTSDLSLNGSHLRT